MITTTIFPGRYVQGKDARKKLGEEFARFGEKGFVICDPFIKENLFDEFEPYMKEEISVDIEVFGGECSDEEIERLLGKVNSSEYHFIVGLGGGKTLDTSKAVAYKAKLPVAIIPTIAATDAPCSALAVIYTSSGEFERYLFLPKNPDLVLMDTQVVTEAPVRFLKCGIGDALATWFEAESCKNNYAPNMTGNPGSMSAYSLAKLCYDTLLEYGEYAKTACESNIVTQALEKVVEANTLLSGLGFESGGLATAHAVHNGLTVLEETHNYYHGEKVAFGTLVSLFLTDKPVDTINQVYSFSEKIGLPTTLADIGLKKPSDEDLRKVAKASCAEGETIHNETIPVNEDMVFAAIKAANAEGRKRKDRYNNFEIWNRNNQVMTN